MLVGVKITRVALIALAGRHGGVANQSVAIGSVVAGVASAGSNGGMGG